MKKLTASILSAMLMLSMVFSSSVFAANDATQASAWDSFVGLFTKATTTADTVGVQYKAHIQNKGTMTDYVTGPTEMGTRGEGLRMEGFWIKLTNAPADLKIKYDVQIENEGWLKNPDDVSTWFTDDQFAGSQEKSQRIETIKLVLVDSTGAVSKNYSVQYKGHVQNIGNVPENDTKYTGTTGWYADGEQLGTVGSSLRLEALQVQIVQKASDLTAYNAAVALANTAKAADYTTASYAALTKALADNVVTATDVQSKVDAATTAINDAYAALVPVGQAGLTVTTSMAGAASVASGQSLVDIGTVTLTAKGDAVTVTGLKINRTGLSADTDLSGISAWDGATRLNVPSIVSNGVATLGFTSNVVIPANTSKTINIKANIDALAPAGSQIVLSLKDKSSIVTTTAVTGTFPASTGTLTVASVTLGQLNTTLAGDSAGGPVYPGKAGDQSFAKFKIAASGEAVKLTTVTLTQDGSVGDNDLSSIKLFNAATGTQVGATGTLSNRKITFNVSGDNIVVANGATVQLEVKGTVNGSAAGRTVQFSVANETDVQGIGQTYGTSIISNSTQQGTLLSSAPASLNVALDTTNPAAGTIGSSSVVKFTSLKVQALNEPVQLQKIALAATATGGLATDLSKVTLKVGDTTIGSVQSFFGTNPNTLTLSNPITIAAGDSVVIDVYATTASSLANGNKYKIALAGTPNTITAVGTVSGKTFNVNSGASGNIQTIGAQEITAKIATNAGATIFANQINQNLGTINIATNLSKTVNVSSVNVSLTNPGNITNLRLVDANGKIVSNTIGTPAASNALTLSSTLAVAANTTIGLTVTGDIAYNAAATTTVTSTGAVGITADDGQSVDQGTPSGSLLATVGTGVNINGGDLTILNSLPDLKAGNVAQGAKGVELARGTLTLANSDEPVIIKTIHVQASFTGANLPARTSNYVIKDGGGNVLATVSSLNSGDNEIQLTAPLTISKTATQQIKVYADFASNADGGDIIALRIGNTAAAFVYTGKYTGTTVTTSAQATTAIQFKIAASKVTVTANALTDVSLETAAVGRGQVLGSFTFTNSGTQTVQLSQVNIADVLATTGTITSGNHVTGGGSAKIQLVSSDWTTKFESDALVSDNQIIASAIGGQEIYLGAGESITLNVVLSGNTAPVIGAGNSTRLKVDATATEYLVDGNPYVVDNSVTSPSTITWKTTA